MIERTTWLVSFTAEYYCQGYEWGLFQRLVYAHSFDEACHKIKYCDIDLWMKNSPKDFKNLTIL